MDWNTRQRLREAYLELGKSMGVTHFLTLQTNHNWSVERLTKLIGKYAARMDDIHLGSMWSKHPISNRMNGLFFVEGDAAGGSIHAHGIVRFPYGNEWGRNLLTQHFWKKLCPSGSVNLQAIWSEGASEYSSKSMRWRSYDSDRIVLLADFMSEKSRSSLTN